LVASGLAIVFALGVAFRVYAYRSVLGIPNSDEAVLGLMARHMLHGHFTTFLWGEAYGGPQEIFFALPGFAIAGSSYFALRLAPLMLFLLSVYLTWRVGLRLLGRNRALAAVALFWIWPGFVIFELEHETSFYALDLVYCTLLILLALRIVERPDALRVGLFGLVAGLAFWETSQIVPIAIPVVAWTIWKQPRCLKWLPLALGLFILGMLPWLVWNIGHHWGSLHLKSGPHVSYGERLRLFVSPVLPMLLGLRISNTQAPVLPVPLLDLVYAILFGLFVYGAWRTRRQLVSILYVTAAGFPFVYAVAEQTFDATAPRYVFVLAPVLVLLLAQLATSHLRAAAVIAVCLASTIVFLHRFSLYRDPMPHAPRNIAPLLATLDRLKLDRVYADLWAAYVIDFDSKERILAVENKFDTVSFPGGRAALPDDPVVRSPEYEAKVRDDPNHGFVLFRKTVDSVPIVPALDRHGYRRVLVGPFVVFVPPRPSA
jgi:hypothetical protein